MIPYHGEHQYRIGAVYRSVNRTEADSKVMERLQQGEIDYVTVMSSAAAVSLVDLFGDLLRKTSLISISPLTTKTLCDLGYPPKAEASQYTLTGMVQALVSCVQSRNVSEPQP